MAVVAPSGPVDRGRLAAGCALLRDLGLDVVTGAHVTDRTGYLAGEDGHRAADLQAAWCDPAIRAVLCARGGYGAMRVLDRLDWDALAEAGPKLLHGASDVTALHQAFGARLGLVTAFGPMVAAGLPVSDDSDRVTVASLRAALFTPRRERVIVPPRPCVLRPGRVTGTLCGGNLSMLAATWGTPFAPASGPGRIVLLEDVNEEPYRVDRLLTQLLLGGWFDGVAGVVLGSWIAEAPAGALLEVLAERLRPLGVPILGGFPIGHGRPQLTVPLGWRVHLDADEPKLTIPAASP